MPHSPFAVPGHAVADPADATTYAMAKCFIAGDAPVAQGTRLLNPIVVHAWNPRPPVAPGCPAGVRFYSGLTPLCS
ncbi:hypothetical protein TUM20985_20630 [Mycobacterium antarcticum]|uniref:hypothetical protein n=1 Tax=unclassified Mycolicibacterium TaxID=2636767 RepID=UPI0023A4C600|nr:MULTISPECIES: hypothetical protein [unclassified Mycolicibacterium]BDX31516.1 hypothetical protein TUM20985_20630 [Mycolicibacterium sp. TUM20985]GLP74863.1 hypothetical protein TUM20983_19730 [Mycolicibacterium sp. TUM20983]GLP80663.1 hypothetical protein TUM20984_20830 [Mycolicibacterium sp. TUM20984]